MPRFDATPSNANTSSRDCGCSDRCGLLARVRADVETSMVDAI